MRRTTQVVIPHRGIDHGKTRLSGMLGPEGRATLSTAMLRRVTAACRGAVDDVVVISPDPQLRRMARELGIGFTLQAGLGMNEALTQAREMAMTDGVSRLAIVSADLPEVQPADIVALLEAADGSPSVAIAPDRTGTGTNALVVQPLSTIPFRFGAMSRWAHVEEARRASVIPIIVERPGLAFDIDLPADLAAWRSGSEPSSASAVALEGVG